MGKNTSSYERTNRIEWVIGAASAALISAILIFLVHEGLTSTNGSPRLSISTETTSDEAHIRYVVRNDGHQAAANVQVTALVRDIDGTVVDRRTIEIDYVPAGSRQRGGLYLPPGGTVEFRIDGYVDP